MEIGGNKGAIKGHYLNSYHHIIHSLVTGEDIQRQKKAA